jgi:signal transduction histidine kinase
MTFMDDATAGALLAASGFLVVLAGSFAVGDRLRPTWGLRWFALAMVLTLLRAIGSASSLAARPEWATAAAMLAALNVSALYVGVRAYIEQPVRGPGVWLVGGMLVWFGLRSGFEWVGLGAMAGPWASGVIFAYLAFLCVRRMRSFAGGAYVLAAVVFILHPVLVLGIGPLVVAPDMKGLRGWGVMGSAVVGLGLLMAAMGRLRVELEREIARRCQAEASLREANASLEARVKDRTAELEELVSDLESFNHMVSHDLRGPLGGMKGLAEVCQQGLQSGDLARVARYLGVMQQEADRLGQLVSQLLELAKVTHAQLERHETELGDVLDRALDVLRLSHGADAVSCVTATPLPRATVDPVLLQQVFVNLIGNAIKFAGLMAHPEVRVRSDEAAAQIVVEVRDNGPGFSPEQARSLFQPFVRLHGKAVEGNGIGLTIVRRIVERHGGTVWAEGQVGAGARFFFSLPV